LSREEERQTIAGTLSRIAEMTGRKPGRLARRRSRRDLAHARFSGWGGLCVRCRLVNDDQPYFMRVGGKWLVSIPYSYEINDATHFQYRNGTIDEFERMIRRQFDTLCSEGAHSGRVMAICLHPYVIGVPHRIAGLDPALQYIRSHDRVWFATGQEIVGAWLQSGVTF
jgi:predicted small secreted protein